jgi:hypothetical protein
VIAHGSIPLIDGSFHPPPVVLWDGISHPLAYRTNADGSRALALPSAQRTAALLQRVHAHATAFECEPTNPLMVRYLGRELARVATLRDGVDPSVVQKAASRVGRFAGCRAVLQRVWSSRAADDARPPPPHTRAPRLLLSLDCYAQPFNRSDCGCAREVE